MDLDPRDSMLAQAASWDAAADGRDRWFGHLESAYRPVTLRMLELANVQPGSKVLDVGTGFGEPALSAAKLAGPAGKVLGVDVSAEGISIAKRRAREAEVDNLEFSVMDAHHLQFPDKRFDVVLCRLVLMFLPDLAPALSEIRRVLKPGGLMAAAVLGSPAKTPLVWIWEQSRRTYSGKGRRPVPNQAGREDGGAFSLSDRRVLHERIAAAGFSNVGTEPVDATFRFTGFDEIIDYLVDTREDVRSVFETASAKERAAIIAAIGKAASRYQTADGNFDLPSETNVVVASA